MNKNVLSLILSGISVLIATAVLVYMGENDIAVQVGFWFFIAVAFV